MWLDGTLKFLGLERRDARLKDWPDIGSIFGIMPTAAGVAVTAESALQSPTFLACVRVIAETLGSMPVHLFEKGQNGERERVSDHPAAELLSGDWAPWESGTDTRTAIQFDALLHGAGYGQVLRVGSEKRPKEIHRLSPTSTTIDRSGSEPVVKTMSNGVEKRLDWRDVIVITPPGAAPGRPMSLVTLLREAIGLDLVMIQHQSRLFSNGARPSGVLKTGDGKLAPERLDQLRDSWNKFMNGENAGRTAVLESGWSFEPLTLKSTDAQFLELRRLAGQDIARGCKVPGTLVNDLDRATWRNVEELNRQFLQMTLLPWIERWVGALSRALLTPVERQTMYLEFIPEDLLRGDITARFTAYRQACGGAFLSPDEIRALENRPPIEGGDKLILQAGQGGADDQPAAPPKPLKSVA